MGFFFSKFYSLISARKCKILMVGLDAAGKTTVLTRLKLNETVNTIPTIGFNVDTIEYGWTNLSRTRLVEGLPGTESRSRLERLLASRIDAS